MSKRILIIEEKEGYSQGLLPALNEHGYLALTVNDPVTGIRQAEEFKPDLVIIDLVHPSDSGFAIVERLKLSEETRPIPIIVVSGSGFPEDKKRISQVGVVAFIERPTDNKFILEAIRKVFHGKKSAAKIVVVDDDPILVRLLQARLSANGFEVIPITNSEEALKTIATEDPDLVITDIIMPNVSGWKITQELKSNEALKNIPVILLSSLIEKEGKAERHEVGDYFLSKPVMVEKLIAKINDMLKTKPST